MTKTPTLAGELMHFTATGITYIPRDSSAFPMGEISKRGDELLLTDEIIEANTDRLGRCFFADLHSTEDQIAKYGRVVMARGPRPDGMLSTEPGTIDHELARARERRDAYAIPQPEIRKATLDSIKERYGDGPKTSRTLNTLG